MPEESSPSIFVIFGITGDLSQRYLLPSLYHLFKDGLLDEKTVILGISRRDVSSEELLENVELCVNEIDKVCDPVALKKVQGALRMHKMNQTDPEEYSQLLSLLNDIEEEKRVCMNRLYYLSIPPQMFGPIVQNLGEQGLNKSCQHGNADTRLLVEKPFGYDLASARKLIEETSHWFDEQQIFRIDHYLAKTMVQTMLTFRSTHPEIDQLWNKDNIEKIEITAIEKLGIEGRAEFYEEVGALRDFIQSHLLQILAVVTMDLPVNLSDSRAMHENRLRSLQAIEPITEPEMKSRAKRGQYEGYREEVGNPESVTETYAEVSPEILSERWQGVHVTLRTGKALSERRAEIRIVFRPEAKSGDITFRIQPDPKIIVNSSPDASDFLNHLSAVTESLNTNEVVTSSDAYERVLYDAARGDHTLFTTSEEIIAAWKIIADVVTAWSKNSEGLIFYPKGSEEIDG